MLLDTGAGVNAIPSHVLPELARAHVPVHLLALDKPVTALLADNTTTIALTSVVTFDLLNPITNTPTPVTFYVIPMSRPRGEPNAPTAPLAPCIIGWSTMYEHDWQDLLPRRPRPSPTTTTPPTITLTSAAGAPTAPPMPAPVDTPLAPPPAPAAAKQQPPQQQQPRQQQHRQQPAARPPPPVVPKREPPPVVPPRDTQPPLTPRGEHTKLRGEQPAAPSEPREHASRPTVAAVPVPPSIGPDKHKTTPKATHADTSKATRTTTTTTTNTNTTRALWPRLSGGPRPPAQPKQAWPWPDTAIALDIHNPKGAPPPPTHDDAPLDATYGDSVVLSYITAPNTTEFLLVDKAIMAHARAQGPTLATAQQLKDAAAFAELRARELAKRPLFVNKADHDRLMAVVDRLAHLFTEGTRPQDGISHVHIPVDVLKAGASLPHVSTRHLSAAKMAEVTDWIAQQLHNGVLRPATVRGPAPAPTHVIRANGKVRVVHDTSALKNVFAEFRVVEPTPDEKLARLAGSRVFAKFDIPGAFYSVILNPATHPFMRQISIGNNIFDSTRAIMGSPNSSAFLAYAMQQVIGPELHRNVIATADDIAMCGRGGTLAEAQKHLVDVLEELAERLIYHNVTLKASKTTLYTDVLHYCGNIITADGHRRDPASLDAIQAAHLPTNGAELASLYYGAQWCATYIPNFQARFAHIADALNRMHKDAGSAKSDAIRKYSISKYNITPEHCAALRQACLDCVRLSHRDPNMDLILTTDASKTGFGAALYQIPAGTHDTFLTSNTAQPLAFSGGTWNATQRRYPMHELEGLSVIKALERTRFFIDDGTKLRVLVDNEALVQIFDPASEYLAKAVNKPAEDRLLRWCARFHSIGARILHIKGSANHIADLLSRSELPFPNPDNDDADDDDVTTDATNPILAAIRLDNAIKTVTDAAWRTPVLADIAASSAKHKPTHKEAARHGFTLDPHTRTFTKGHLTYVPQHDHLRTKLLVLAHCGEAGHHGIKTTLSNIADSFWWDTIQTDAAAFVHGCIHCAVSQQGVTAVPYGTIVRGSKRNQVVSLDYLYLGYTTDDNTRMLIITDTLTNYSIYSVATSENADDTLALINRWVDLFGAPEKFVMDSGPGFKNDKVTTRVKQLTKIEPHYTTPGAHGAHGRQERLNRELGSIFRKLQSEHRLNANQWPKLAPLIIDAYNNKPVDSLGGAAPVELFLGLPRRNPVTDVLLTPENRTAPMALGSPELREHLKRVLPQLEQRAIEIDALHTHRLQRAAAKRVNKPHVKRNTTTFNKDDWVLVHKSTTALKFDPLWALARIVKRAPGHAHDQLWVVSYQSNFPSRHGKQAVVHVNRLRLLSRKHYRRTPELNELIDFYENHIEHVKELMDVRINNRNKHVELLVNWHGRAGTDWNKLQDLARDVPHLLKDFLDKRPDSPLILRARRELTDATIRP